jgi:hypothetical protein
MRSGNGLRRRVILLIGLPRSGTTWLGKIFDSHPDTLYRHEPDSVRNIDGLPPYADVRDTERYRAAISGFVSALPDMRLTKVTTTLPIFPKSYYAPPQLVMRRLSVLATKLASRFLGELPVIDVVSYERVRDLPIVWKSIESYGRLGVLSRAIDGCRAVLILRHPCGYVASVQRGENRHKFSGSTPSHEDFGMFAKLLETEQAREHDLTIDRLKSMHPVERLAWRWAINYEKAMDDVAEQPNCRYVCYEEVCKQPLEQSRGLFAFANLSWSTQTEDFIRKSTASENTAYYSIFKDPLKSAYKWKNELASEDIDRVLKVVEVTKPGRLYATMA